MESEATTPADEPFTGRGKRRENNIIGTIIIIIIMDHSGNIVIYLLIFWGNRFVLVRSKECSEGLPSEIKTPASM